MNDEAGTVRERHDLGRGLFVEAADASMFDELNANLRDADRRECEVFGEHGESGKNWENAWGVRKRQNENDAEGDLLCITGWARFKGTEATDARRLMLCVSTNHVWRHWIDYGRRSMDVFRFMARYLPPWVTDIYALPMASYDASIRWQERILGFKQAKLIEACGVPHILMHKKKEGQTW